jgi:hypothetical protein
MTDAPSHAVRMPLNSTSAGMTSSRTNDVRARTAVALRLGGWC